MEDPSLTLIERLADRLCHDFASSAQAVASGFDLLREAQDFADRQEAEAFLAEAVASQKAKIVYARRTYGPAPSAADTAELERLIQPLFIGARPKLDWQVTAPVLDPTTSRALLILAQLATDILATGGIARLSVKAEDSAQMVELDAEGPRPRLREEVLCGLTGAASEAGLGGRWAQGAFLRRLALSAGGEIRLDERPGGVRISLSVPTG